jgi:hypothetical protein
MRRLEFAALVTLLLSSLQTLFGKAARGWLPLETQSFGAAQWILPNGKLLHSSYYDEPLTLRIFDPKTQWLQPILEPQAGDAGCWASAAPLVDKSARRRRTQSTAKCQRTSSITFGRVDV